MAENVGKPKRASGIRLKDAEYSSRYVEELSRWMEESGNFEFENQLIKDGLVSLELKNAVLGLEFILDSLSPRDDMQFESGTIKFVPLDPETQIPRRVRNTQVRKRNDDRWLAGLEMSERERRSVTQADEHVDFRSLSRIPNFSEKVFPIPEPPYAETCRNSPEDVRLSWLRWLRDIGEFDSSSTDVQTAAYLLSKGWRKKHEIVLHFTHLITWDQFAVAQGSVHRVVQRTMPDRFRRLEVVLAKLSEKQREAFDTRLDIDSRPTLKMTAQMLDIDVSSLKERLAIVKRKFTDEFEEYSGSRPRPHAWSRKTDLIYAGLYRKSLEYFRPGTLTSRSGQVVSITSSRLARSRRFIASPTKAYEAPHVRTWLRLRRYSPELKTVLAGAARGDYRVEKGEFFHHPDTWKRTRIREKLETD